MNLCRFQNMDQCSKQYCDFWNQSKQTCSLALEVHQRVELLEKLNRILDKMEKTGKEDVAIRLINHLASMNTALH